MPSSMPIAMICSIASGEGKVGLDRHARAAAGLLVERDADGRRRHVGVGVAGVVGEPVLELEPVRGVDRDAPATSRGTCRPRDRS